MPDACVWELMPHSPSHHRGCTLKGQSISGCRTNAWMCKSTGLCRFTAFQGADWSFMHGAAMSLLSEAAFRATIVECISTGTSHTRCHSPIGSQLSLTVLQPAEPQVADGDPLNPVLQVAVQDESNALIAPHEKLPSATLGLPTHTAAPEKSDGQHWVHAILAAKYAILAAKPSG